jgi:hypothetical protein
MTDDERRMMTAGAQDFWSIMINMMIFDDDDNGIIDENNVQYTS